MTSVTRRLRVNGWSLATAARRLGSEWARQTGEAAHLNSCSSQVAPPQSSVRGSGFVLYSTCSMMHCWLEVAVRLKGRGLLCYSRCKRGGAKQRQDNSSSANPFSKPASNLSLP